jgi:hypothetical protein
MSFDFNQDSFSNSNAYDPEGNKRAEEELHNSMKEIHFYGGNVYDENNKIIEDGTTLQSDSKQQLFEIVHHMGEIPLIMGKSTIKRHWYKKEVVDHLDVTLYSNDSGTQLYIRDQFDRIFEVADKIGRKIEPRKFKVTEYVISYRKYEPLELRALVID